MKERLKAGVMATLGNPLFWIACIYMFVPTDIIPDAVPIGGQVDDVLAQLLAGIIYGMVMHKSGGNSQ